MMKSPLGSGKFLIGINAQDVKSVIVDTTKMFLIIILFFQSIYL